MSWEQVLSAVSRSFVCLFACHNALDCRLASWHPECPVLPVCFCAKWPAVVLAFGGQIKHGYANDGISAAHRPILINSGIFAAEFNFPHN